MRFEKRFSGKVTKADREIEPIARKKKFPGKRRNWLQNQITNCEDV
jgi:hypothetical protein